ncbi:YghX family hydrolase [Kitasatospora albolonga]|uniref:dienelactone hydrolase family protein n=1 Tax=Kitasatospora albolonga TaxID=68173 RepID=UPI0031ED8299
MCHPTDSRPPGIENPGEVAEHGIVRLTTEDGNVFEAYRAVPAEPNGRSVVILPDVRGVHPYYRELAQRFAEAGFTVLALDYYGRTAGIGARDDEFDWQQYLPLVQPDEVALDVKAAVAHLAETAPGPVFTVGFCFGGSQSWRLSAAGLGLAGTIGFYGQPKLVEDAVDGMEVPLLLLIAGSDVATTPEEFDAFTGALEKAGKTYESQVYEGAPHSFFDRGFAEWQEACTDAWGRILDFTARHAAVAN